MKIKFTWKNDFRINKAKAIFLSIRMIFLMKFLSSHRIIYHGNKRRPNLPITTIDLVKRTLYKNGALSPVMMFRLN
jgi:hypothetical protein